MGVCPLEELDAVLSHVSDYSLFLLEQGFVHLKNTSHLSGCRVVQMRGFFQRETNIHLLRFCSLRRIFHTPQTHSRRGTLCSTQPPHAGTDAVCSRSRGCTLCVDVCARTPHRAHQRGLSVRRSACSRAHLAYRWRNWWQPVVWMCAGGRRGGAAVQ